MSAILRSGRETPMLNPIICPPGWRVVTEGGVEEGDLVVMLHDDRQHAARRHLAGMDVIHFRAVMRKIPNWEPEDMVDDETPLESEVIGDDPSVDFSGDE